MSGNLLQGQNLVKTYHQGGTWSRGRSVRAVDGVDIDIEAGRCLALVGPSGSGKSTLGRLVLGLESPDDGDILYKGIPLRALRGPERLAARRNMQVVFQNSQAAVNPRFTALDIVGEPLRNFDRLSGTALADRAADLMRRVGLSPDDLDKLPHQFSGGELQRLCIARALAPEPELIVLDEAVSSLDLLSQGRILDLLLDLKEKTSAAFLFVTHDLRLVFRLADAMAVMAGGKIVGRYDDLSDGPGEGVDETLRELLRSALPRDPAAMTVQ